jgi:hypothetical protein
MDILNILLKPQFQPNYVMMMIGDILLLFVNLCIRLLIGLMIAINMKSV